MNINNQFKFKFQSKTKKHTFDNSKYTKDTQMMRPSTAKAMQQKREANRMQAREAREDVENDLMIISSMELNK